MFNQSLAYIKMITLPLNKVNKSSEKEQSKYIYLFWIFFVGCILGVVVETIWCVLKYGMIESRAALIYGPFNPVYGFGALVMTICLYKLTSSKNITIFLCSTGLGAAFEFVCSFLQERCFGTVSWDYSGSFFNIGGRINLLYAAFWGVLGIVWIRLGFPLLSKLIGKFPHQLIKPATFALTVFMIFNLVISVMAVGRQAERRAQLPPQNGIEAFLDQHFPDERLDRIYANAVVVK